MKKIIALRKFVQVLIIIYSFIICLCSFVFAETFKTQEECEQKTSRICDFQMCDYKCPKDFVNGWVATNKVKLPEKNIGEINQDVKIQGQVSGIDVHPMTYDSPGLMNLYTGDGKELEVYFSARSRADIECLGLIKNGDKVEVFGQMTGKNSLTVYHDNHYVKILKK